MLCLVLSSLLSFLQTKPNQTKTKQNKKILVYYLVDSNDFDSTSTRVVLKNNNKQQQQHTNNCCPTLSYPVLSYPVLFECRFAECRPTLPMPIPMPMLIRSVISCHGMSWNVNRIPPPFLATIKDNPWSIS